MMLGKFPLFAPKQDEIAKFAELVHAALRGDQSGKIYQYMYKDPRNSKKVSANDNLFTLDQSLEMSPDYYVFRNSYELIQRNKHTWSNILGPRRTVIELGVGSKTALIKPIRLLEILNAEKYIPNDVSKEYVRAAEKFMSRLFPQTKVQGKICDFNDPSIDWSEYKNPAVFMLGSTVSNFDNIVDLLENIKRIAGENGDIFIDYDSNQNEVVLNKAYGSEAQINQRKRILFFIKEIFQPKGFNPHAFYWKPEWQEDQKLYLNNLVCDEPQSFSLNGITHANVNKITISKMYKYDKNAFVKLASKAGLKTIGEYTDNQGYMVMSHLKSKS